MSNPTTGATGAPQGAFCMHQCCRRYSFLFPIFGFLLYAHGWQLLKVGDHDFLGHLRALCSDLLGALDPTQSMPAPYSPALTFSVLARNCQIACQEAWLTAYGSAGARGAWFPICFRQVHSTSYLPQQSLNSYAVWRWRGTSWIIGYNFPCVSQHPC